MYVKLRELICKNVFGEIQNENEMLILYFFISSNGRFCNLWQQVQFTLVARSEKEIVVKMWKVSFYRHHHRHFIQFIQCEIFMKD
jgi:hypothetical protein